MRQSHVARIFGVCTYSVSKWVRKYKAEGEAGLATQTMGRPQTGGRLQHKYWLAFQRLIMTKTPDELGLPYAMWDRKAISALLKAKFDVSLSYSAISDLLKKMGFSPQRPTYAAIQRDDKKNPKMA